MLKNLKTIETTETPSLICLRDSEGRKIQKTNIVRVVTPSNCEFAGYQGVVIEPHSRESDDGFSVAVFFNAEIPASSFFLRSCDLPLSPKEWDEQYLKDCPNILLESDLWRKCPRVIFCQAEQLLVEDDWATEHLFRRYFKELTEIPKRERLVPNSKPCEIKGCPNDAIDRSVLSVWGVGWELHTCSGCFEEWNGMQVEELPELRARYP